MFESGAITVPRRTPLSNATTIPSQSFTKNMRHGHIETGTATNHKQLAMPDGRTWHHWILQDVNLEVALPDKIRLGKLELQGFEK